MKKALAILLVYSILMTLLVVSPFTANADEKNVAETGYGETSGTTGDCTWEIEGTKLTISGKGKMENYTFSAPWVYSDITDVLIEKGVTSIGNYAFYDCTSLKSVTIPDSVTSIGYSAFYKTAWYNNQPDGLVYAGKVAYKMKGSCPSDVVIKDGTLGIADYAFSNCTGLTSVTIPDSVTSIGSKAFDGCTELKSVTLSRFALENFKQIFNIENIESVTISDNVTSIGRSAFYSCKGLTSVTIPDSVTSIGDFAFYGCSSLTSVTIPDSVTSIGSSAFSNCTGLTSVTIPDSVTSIGSKAFDGCTELKSVTLSRFALENFKQIFSIENIESVTISDNVTSIRSCVFKGCIKLMSVTIPDSVTSIEDYAFYNCIRLTDINIPNSVTSIGESAFYNCIRLTRINIPDSVRSIGYEAFFNCMKLMSVTIPDLVMSIDECAFGYYYDNSYHGAYDTQKNKLTGFTIYGYYGSQAWRYANNCKFNFIALDDEPSDPTKTTDREIFGDIDGDGAITVVDSTFLQRYTIKAETPYPIGEKMK